MSDAGAALGAAALPCRGSEHLSRVTREVDLLATELRALLEQAHSHAPEALAALRTDARDAASAATLMLDGAGTGPGRVSAGTGDLAGAGAEERAGTWVDALQHSPGIGFDAPDEREEAEIARMSGLERDGVHAAQQADDLAPAFAAGNADAAGLGSAIIELHARLTTGLVAPERTGMLRRGPRVVHDASVGRIIHFPTEPQHLADAWEGMLRSLTAHAAPQAREPALVRSGILQLELLRHHPFDAANGRLARAAARLLLVADGLMDDVATPEVVLAEDPLGYLDGVAASMRRGDATAWIERWGESVTESLLRARTAVRALLADSPAAEGPESGPASPGDADAASITLAELAEQLGTDVVQARERASELVVAGGLRRVIGSGGLRFTRG